MGVRRHQRALRGMRPWMLKQVQHDDRVMGRSIRPALSPRPQPMRSAPAARLSSGAAARGFTPRLISSEEETKIDE